MKKVLILLFLSILSFTMSFAKDKEVVLTVQGQGYTSQEAVVNALQAALAQVNGVFVSTSTELKNDEYTASDANISFGKVKDYDVLNKYSANNIVYVTVKATIILNKNQKLKKSKGVTNTFNGAAFVDESKKKRINDFNKKVYELNIVSEQIALDNLLKVVKATLPYTYDLKETGSKEPYLSGNNYIFEKQITFVFNDNFENLKKMIETTLANIGFDNQKDAKTYSDDGYEIYAFNIESKQGKTDKKRVRNAWFGTLLGGVAGALAGKYLGNSSNEKEALARSGVAAGAVVSQTHELYYTTRYFRTDVSSWVRQYKKAVNEEMYNFYIKEIPTGIISKIEQNGKGTGRIVSANKVTDLIKEGKSAVDLSKSEYTRQFAGLVEMDSNYTIEYQKNAGWKIRYSVPSIEIGKLQGYEIVKNN